MIKSMTCCRRFLGFLKSEKARILLHGCWRSAPPHLRHNLMWILLKFTEDQSSISQWIMISWNFFLFIFLAQFVFALTPSSCRRNQELIKELSTPPPGYKDLYFPTKYSQSFLTQCKACFWKQHWSYWRNPPYNAVRFLLTILIGCLFGVIFWNKGYQT